VQRLRRLASSRAARWEERRFVVEGPKLLEEATRAGAHLETVFVEAGCFDLDAARSWPAGDLVEVERGVLARAGDARTPQGVAAIVEMVDVPLATAVDDGTALAVLCAGLQDPGNAGSVVRAAAAAGASAVVFTSGAVDMYNPKAVRASAGAVFRVPLVAAQEAGAALHHLGRCGIRRVAAVPRGGRDYSGLDMTGPTALVLGSESHGIPPDVAALLDETVSIPMRRGVESLNVAMAAAVFCFEAARQREAEPPGRPG
jgi:TrmH family RNA methyltransferase